ncbi:hypothetical protein LCGC14_2999130, partial [marine sediment metagenome]
DMSVKGGMKVAGDLEAFGDFSVDGTLAFQDAVLTGDGTFTFDPIAGETGPTFKIFGDWSTRASNTIYTARSDGIVMAYRTGAGLVRTFTPSDTLRGNMDGKGTITMPVKSGDSWDVSNGSAVFWLPFGDNT